VTNPLDYHDPEIRKEVLERQRRGLWTPEQTRSLAKHFGLEPGMHLLDAGCGYGYSLRAFGPWCMPGGTLFGCDRDDALLRTARTLAAEEGLGATARFITGDITCLPFDSNRMDLTIAQIVLCHLAEPEKALDEMIRVTRPGGCVVVMDNARSLGPGGGWSSLREPSIPQLLFNFEAMLRHRRGRKRLGLGDFTVGCKMPGWMEKRGLKNVSVRGNEKVSWIAPPYASPDQQLELQKLKERLAVPTAHRSHLARQYDPIYRAGGADRAMIRRLRRSGRRNRRRVEEALEKGTLAYAAGTPLWCVWGFK